MSNELTVEAAGLTFEKSGVKAALAAALDKFDVSGADYVLRTFVVPTTAGGTALPLGDIGTPGFCLIINRDTTNYVQILNAVSGSVCLKLKAGEFALFRFGAAAPALLANTASVTVEYLLVED